MTTTCECPAPSNGGLECLINANTGERGLTKIGYCTPSNCPTPTYTYQWVAGTWGTYSIIDTCNAQKTRTVTCQRNDGVTVPDSSCTTSGTKPSTISACNHCRWIPGAHFTVVLGTKYCTTGFPICDTALVGQTHLCTSSPSNCLLIWCDGMQEVCTSMSITNYCS
jgi:hypothetical protein